MEERAVAGPSGDQLWSTRGRVRSLALAVGRHRFPILALDQQSCLVEAPAEAPFRGRAEILEGDRLAALCLILLSAQEGNARRITFKRITPARDAAPRDFAD